MNQYIDLSNSINNGCLDNESIVLFQEHILNYYREQGRSFVWRQPPHDPYCIMVSEIMLQQTQTHRVIDKFALFVEKFPTFKDLAEASLHEVLTAWQGLGYNRRGQALHKSAQKVVHEYAGILPSSPQVLQTFPGIGPSTAASISAFAFNQPTVFIETNVRTVFLQTFFPKSSEIKDNQLVSLVEQTLYTAEPRHWYYALMDYGVMLKKAFNNPGRRSAHHVRQSTFVGSERQIRGMIVRLLTQYTKLTFMSLCDLIPREQERVARNLEKLCKEELICQINDYYSLPQ